MIMSVRDDRAFACHSFESTTAPAQNEVSFVYGIGYVRSVIVCSHKIESDPTLSEKSAHDFHISRINSILQQDSPSRHDINVMMRSELIQVDRVSDDFDIDNAVIFMQMVLDPFTDGEIAHISKLTCWWLLF